MPIVEYGPGTMEEALLLIEAAQSSLYIPVDLSNSLAEKSQHLRFEDRNCAVRPHCLDFFADNSRAIVKQPALAALLGMTIDNIPGPIPDRLPEARLVKAFRNLCRPIGHSGGYLLVSSHAEQDGQRNAALYNEEWHAKFSRNIPYRMQAELDMDGFDPDLFEYEPQWYSHCSLIAHSLRATKDQTFAMGPNNEHIVTIRQGDVFHYNNSFKYPPAFFESCARKAGLSLAHKWEDGNNLMMYLFKVAPLRNHLSLVAPNLAAAYSASPPRAS